MKTTTTLLAAASTLVLMACGNGTPVNTDATTVDQAQSFTLTKVSQRTQRFDCNGNLTSDQVEMQQMPTQELSIQPKVLLNMYSLDVTNLTNGQPARMISGNANFWIDCGDGALSLWVNQGANQLSYQFYYCDKYVPDQNGICPT